MVSPQATSPVASWSKVKCPYFLGLQISLPKHPVRTNRHQWSPTGSVLLKFHGRPVGFSIRAWRPVYVKKRPTFVCHTQIDNKTKRRSRITKTRITAYGPTKHDKRIEHDLVPARGSMTCRHRAISVISIVSSQHVWQTSTTVSSPRIRCPYPWCALAMVARCREEGTLERYDVVEWRHKLWDKQKL